MLAHAPELVAIFDVRYRDARLRKSAQHHKRIVDPTAETLRACEQRHCRGVVLRSQLEHSPRRRVRGFVILTRDGVER
jgi:hypothetical protein